MATRLKNGQTVPALNDAEKIDEIRGHVRSIIEILGLDPQTDPNLNETDRRVAKMYLEMFSGLSEGAEPNITCFPNEENYSSMVMEKDIPFYSLCAHHFVPFYGHAHMAYIPNERIIGLSKMPRIVEFYAKRPQLQERLTEQVAGYLEEVLAPGGVIVTIEARHLCMEMRGARASGQVETRLVRGELAEPRWAAALGTGSPRA